MEDFLKPISVEPIGRSFLIHYLTTLTYRAEHKTDTSKQSKKKSKKAKKNKKSKRVIEIEFNWDVDASDYYDVLGIKQYEIIATVDDVKLAYKKIQAVCHPDKFQTTEEREKAQKRFQLLDNAFKMLTDDLFKKMYDSELDFDDAIPNELELANADVDRSDYNAMEVDTLMTITSENYDELAKIDIETMVAKRSRVNAPQFYAYFGPFFDKFSVYSAKQPVPSLGDEKSSDTQVLKFYKFWENFKSWRDFTHLCDKVDIYDLDHLKSAESKEELKFMKKTNEKYQSSFKKDESLSIASLVESAKNRDPRLIRLEEKERRSILKEEKLKEERRLKREEERLQKEAFWDRKRAEEKQAKLAEERKKQQEQDRVRRELTKLPIELRKLMNDAFFRKQNINANDINLVCNHATREELKSILSFNDSITDDIDKKQSLSIREEQLTCFRGIVKITFARAEEKKRKLAEAERKSKESSKFGTAPWSYEEYKELTRVCSKVPRGTVNRWEAIYRDFNKKKHAAASRRKNNFDSGADGGMQPQIERSMEEVMQTAKDLQKGKIKVTASKSTPAKSGKSSESKKEKPKSELEIELESIAKKYGKRVSDKKWIEYQPKLEVALRTLMPIKKEKQWPSDVFWSEVSKKLDGKKSAKDCEDRFKYVREVLMCKKKHSK